MKIGALSFLLFFFFLNTPFSQDSTAVSETVVADTAGAAADTPVQEEVAEDDKSATQGLADSISDATPEAAADDSNQVVSEDSAMTAQEMNLPAAAKKPIPAPGMRSVERERARGLSAVVKDTTNTRKIKLIKRNYNHRQQVVLAVGMMLFIGIMMATAQNMNPK